MNININNHKFDYIETQEESIKMIKMMIIMMNIGENENSNLWW